jgi:hypothetical protein
LTRGASDLHPTRCIPGQDLVASCFDGGRWKIDHIPEVDHRGGKVTALGQRGWLVTARLPAPPHITHTRMRADAEARNDQQRKGPKVR